MNFYYKVTLKVIQFICLMKKPICKFWNSGKMQPIVKFFWWNIVLNIKLKDIYTDINGAKIWINEKKIVENFMLY